MYMLQYVIQADLVGRVSGRARLARVFRENGDPVSPGQRRRDGVGLDAQNIPSQGLHAAEEISPSTAHIDEQIVRTVRQSGEAVARSS